jgi:integrase/recombinase XerD
MRPKGSKKNGIKYLSESELAAFMKAVRKNRRDRFLISLILFVGARVSEISQLRLKDVNEQSFQILIQGKKGGTSRHYTLSGRLWKKYLGWMRERAKMGHAAMNPYLFITKYSMHDMPIAEQTVKNAFKKYAVAAGLDKSFSVHSLRHTCAVIRIAEGTPVVFVQKWLRHKSINSTMVYADIASPELKRDEFSKGFNLTAL